MEHMHGPDCVWHLDADGKQRCQTRRNERLRARRAAEPKRPGRRGFRYRDRRQAPDGWEDEFGPVPIKALDSEWYDQVLVDRILNGEPAGRRPHRLEWDVIAGYLAAGHLEAADVARNAGVSLHYVCDLRRARA